MKPQVHTYLVEKKIKPSIQRMAIMDYLLKVKTHPTADEIYLALQPSMPTLSKTTVYNTMKLFASNGAVLCLDIDGKNARFDGDITPHAHFMCNGCGAIFDLPVNEGDWIKKEYLNHFTITDISLYLKGYCQMCSAKTKTQD